MVMADLIGELLRALTDFDPVATRKLTKHTWSCDEASEILALLRWELELAADEPNRITSAFVTTVEVRFEDD